MKNEKGFVIINGGKAEPLPADLFDVLSKHHEDQVIKTLINDVKKEIDKLVNKNKDDD